MVDAIPMKLSDSGFAKLVNKLSKDSANVFITGHAKARMKERKIIRGHIDECLRKGRVIEPAHINIHGNWQATMTRRVAGLSVKVAVVVDIDKRVIVVTVMKED